MARRLGQQDIPYGSDCICNECNKTLPKTREHFYFKKSGVVYCYTCKPCYYKIEKARIDRRKEKAKAMQRNIDELRKDNLLQKSNTRTFPKGHPMNPTREQRQALIDKIESRRVYKNESRDD